MRIIVMRHGKAEKEAACDAERPLAKRGFEQARIMGRCFARLGIRPDAIHTSPYRRARETAAAVLAEMGVNVDDVSETPLLTPGMDPARFLCDLDGECVLCFTHAPLCNALVARCVGAPGTVTDLSTGAACCVVSDHPAGRDGYIEWLFVPDAFPGKD